MNERECFLLLRARVRRARKSTPSLQMRILQILVLPMFSSTLELPILNLTPITPLLRLTLFTFVRLQVYHINPLGSPLYDHPLLYSIVATSYKRFHLSHYSTHMSLASKSFISSPHFP